MRRLKVPVPPRLSARQAAAVAPAMETGVGKDVGKGVGKGVQQRSSACNSPNHPRTLLLV